MTTIDTIENHKIQNTQNVDLLLNIDYISLINTKISQDIMAKASSALKEGCYKLKNKKFDLAIEKLLESVELYFSLNDGFFKEAAVALNSLGLAYLGKGNADNALNAFFKSMDMSLILINNTLEYKKFLSVCLNNIAKAYNVKREYNLALEYQIKCCEIEESIYKANDPKLLDCYTNLCSLYKLCNQIEKAALYAKKIYNICAFEFGVCNIRSNLACYQVGMVYKHSKDYEKAAEWIYKAIIESKEQSEKAVSVASFYYSLAFCFKYLNNLESMIEGFIRAAELLRANNHCNKLFISCSQYIYHYFSPLKEEEMSDKSKLLRERVISIFRDQYKIEDKTEKKIRADTSDSTSTTSCESLLGRKRGFEDSEDSDN